MLSNHRYKPTKQAYHNPTKRAMKIQSTEDAYALFKCNQSSSSYNTSLINLTLHILYIHIPKSIIKHTTHIYKNVGNAITCFFQIKLHKKDRG